MTKDLNLTLRTDILDKALNLEHSVNLILLIYLSIESEDRKAITNKSSSLSFKNKIDLLFDLDILTKDEHNYFLLLMEFRNQFLHNIDCTSFSYAVSILGNDKGKRLLKLNETTTHTDMESQYEEGFGHLYGKTVKITLEKIRKRKHIIEEKVKLLTNLNNKSIYLIDFFFDLINKLFEKYEPTVNDTPEIVKLKSQIFETIGQEIGKLYEAEEYKILQTQLDNSHTMDKLKMYIK